MSKALLLSAVVVIALMVFGLVLQSDQVPPQPETGSQAKQVEALQAEIVRLQAEVETLQQQKQTLAEALSDEQSDLAQALASNQALQSEYSRLAQELATYQQAAAHNGQVLAQAP